MNALTRLSIRHPLRALATAALVALAAAPGLARLELRTEGQALVPSRAPAVVFDRDIRRTFGVRDSMALVVRTEHPGGIFNPGTLRRVRDLTTALGRVEGVGPADITSLATEPGFHFRPGTLQKSPLLEPLPETPEALVALRHDLRRIGLYNGLLVSADRRSTAVVLGVPAGADRQAFYREVQAIAAAQTSGLDRVEVLGAPVAETLLGIHILADLGVPERWLGGALEDRKTPGLIPLALGAMGLVFLLGFRRPAAALLPLCKLGVCLAAVFGLMGWLGVPVYLTTAVLPVILIAVGMTGEVHILRRFSALFSQRPGAGSAELARAALEEVEQPILQASAIAAIGFLSFSLTTLAPVRAFGLFAAAGVGFCLLWSLSATPAILVLLPPGLLARPGTEDRDGRENLFGRLAGLASHRRTVLVLLAAISLVALDGLRRLRVQDSWVDGFAPRSAFAREMRRFDDQFHGAHTLLVTLAAEPRRLAGEVAGESVGDRRLLLPLQAARGVPPAAFEGGFLALESREALPAAAPAVAPRQWSSWVERSTAENGHMVLSWPLQGGSPKFRLQPGPGERVGYELRLEPLSLPAHLRRVRDLEQFLARLPGVGGVLGPATFLETASFLSRPDEPGSRRLPETPDEARILWNNSEVVRGTERLRRLVDAERSRSLVTVFLKRSNYADTRRLMDEVREHERRFLAPAGLQLGFAGDVAVSQALIRAVVSTQVSSLAFSLLGIFALTAWLLRSPRLGLYCALPVTLAVLLDFAVMGWLGIPLGVATSMFASMTLGVGVDSTLHLLERYDRMRTLSGALSSAGPPILIDSLSTSLGFAVLLLSRVPANNRLGGLLALSLLAGLAATLLIVPALLARRRPTSPL